MPSVTFFNTSNLSIQVSVNNGSSFGISSAAAGAWTPQSPSSGGPGWSNTFAAPNVLAPGTNHLAITPAGSPEQLNVALNLPGSVQWSSLQVYIFFNSYGTLSLVVLNNGQFVTSA